MKYEVNRASVQWRIVDGEAVVVNVESSYYYGLNRTGTFVWTLLSEHAMTADDIARRVAETFGVERTRALADVEAVLRDLHSEDLIAET